MTKDIIDVDTAETTPGRKTRKMKSLPGADCKLILELLSEQRNPVYVSLYRRITKGEFLRLKVLVERRAR